jgi:hypothetical protein
MLLVVQGNDRLASRAFPGVEWERSTGKKRQNFGACLKHRIIPDPLA